MCFFVKSSDLRGVHPGCPRRKTLKPRETHLFSGEDGDLAVVDPYFCQKIVQNLSKFVKNCQKLSKILTKFVKNCQKLSKFVKICQKLLKIILFFDKIYLFILPDILIKYTKNTGVYTQCTTGLQNEYHPMLH